MRPFFQLAAIGCSLPLIEAGSFKWNGNQARDVGEYIPAHETGIGRNIQTLAMGPAPTSPAQLRKERSGSFAQRRDTDDPPGSVCGYLEGSSAYPYACAVTDSCLFTTISGTWLTTVLSTYSDYPYCLTMTYDDLVGYTIMNCAATSQSSFELIDYNPVTATSSSQNSAVSSIVTSADNDDNTSTSNPSSTPSSPSATASPTSTSAAKASLPIGAIAGGAVGGIAVIAILILGLVFICRRTSKNRNYNDAQNGGMQPGQPPINGGPPPGGYPTQSAMEQQWQSPPPAFQPGFGMVDNNSNNSANNRASIQKHPYDLKSTSSAYDPSLSLPGSPPPPNQGPSPGYEPSTVTPPLAQGQGLGASPTEPVFQASGTGPNYGIQQHQPQQYNTGTYHEMPSMRGDGELRELA
ncbi:hypothetical protein N0V93_006242 [Gnomoniopsis smithogilvyi]|uniref:Uncharacterized protein n=1 Tax=Gnomoniopsis smithogilvyi TaxID=1191159 RepID=A0A9W8YMV8_9PEZI|nr:hypothetical protein N0V93_006242 [Gnomoniopsis smithogilvyi]